MLGSFFDGLLVVLVVVVVVAVVGVILAEGGLIDRKAADRLVMDGGASGALVD